MTDTRTVEWDRDRGRLCVYYRPADGDTRYVQAAVDVRVDLDEQGHVVDVDVTGLHGSIAARLARYAAAPRRPVSSEGIALDVDARALWLHLGDRGRTARLQGRGTVRLAFDGEVLIGVELALPTLAGPAVTGRP